MSVIVDSIIEVFQAIFGTFFGIYLTIFIALFASIYAAYKFIRESLKAKKNAKAIKSVIDNGSHMYAEYLQFKQTRKRAGLP